jgi:hypothetical protein
MQVLVFVTDDGRSSEGSGPTLVIEDVPTATLPPNPRSLSWRYFATMRSEDVLFGSERAKMQSVLARKRPFITNRLVR